MRPCGAQPGTPWKVAVAARLCCAHCAPPLACAAVGWSVKIGGARALPRGQFDRTCPVTAGEGQECEAPLLLRPLGSVLGTVGYQSSQDCPTATGMEATGTGWSPVTGYEGRSHTVIVAADTQRNDMKQDADRSWCLSSSSMEAALQPFSLSPPITSQCSHPASHPGGPDGGHSGKSLPTAGP